MNELLLHLVDGTSILVPASLSTITTYVLLEQESWFEKEASFASLIVKPGMNVIDIGANLGVYALPLARRVASEGAVYAYEPASAASGLLKRSAVLNGLSNIHLFETAVSDSPRISHLSSAWSDELRSLAADKEGEAVAVTSLDEEDRIRNWRAPDLVKIDAEGEELKILKGGSSFFARHSPLVMFEITGGGEIDTAAADQFRDLGYRIFRLLPGAPILVPIEREEAIDTYEFNLFAAKPDRAAALAAAGWLVESFSEWSSNDLARKAALEIIAVQAFGPVMSALRAPAISSAYRNALAAYAAWRDARAPLPVRYAALCFAHAALRDLCQAEPNITRFSTWARVAWELGMRQACVASLNEVLRRMRQGANLQELFWPANPRFDAITPGRDVALWFMAGTMEQLERASAHSSLFSEDGVNLEWLASQPLASNEILRRSVLKKWRKGQPAALPDRLRRPAKDHVNFELWRSGAISNNLAPRAHA